MISILLIPAVSGIGDQDCSAASQTQIYSPRIIVRDLADFDRTHMDRCCRDT